MTISPCAETMPVHISDAARVLATTLKRPAFGEMSLFGFVVVVSFMFACSLNSLECSAPIREAGLM